MNAMFSVSELIAALFVSGLLWLVFDVARHHPRDAILMIADPERFARMAVAPRQQRLAGRRQFERRAAAFSARAVS